MTKRRTSWLGKRSILWALIAALVSGCGAHAGATRGDGGSETPYAKSGEPAPDADYGYAAEEQSMASAPSDFDDSAASEGVAPAAAPAPPPRVEAAPMRDAERSRPGLGTVWGEDRDSHVFSTVFHRADPEQPFALATLFYNDSEGIRAMANESARFDHGDGGFSVMDGAVTVRLLDEHGVPLPAFEVASRDYVIGEHGEAYSIEIRNHTGGRIEAVTTVDGLDVVDGETGSFVKRGYVIAPFDTLEIDGFRRSEDTVAAFRFGSVRDSYAGKKGKARNVGVIGVALFHELGDSPWSSGEVRRRHTADPFPGRFAAPPPR